MAQAGFCLNGQPCNSWTRVTAGTDAPGIQARMPPPREFSAETRTSFGDGLSTVLRFL